MMAKSSQHAIPTPFHKGELEIQERLGMREKVHNYAPRFIRDHLPDEHCAFYKQLPYLIVGSADDEGRPWASMLVGRPGFISCPNPKTLKVSGRPLPGDPLTETLKDGAQLGFLGIDFQTRRRNRMNGKIAKRSDDGFQIAVDQAFGNCPQYIQTRVLTLNETDPAPETLPPLERNSAIGDEARMAIENADTFFIASMFSEDPNDGRHGVDVSHRGGRPGFVKIVDDRTLIFPDFAGNSHFNTLGNIAVHPKAGLLFPDFKTGDMLYVTGGAKIIWEGAEMEAFKGAKRLVRITVDEVIRAEKSLPLRWDFRDFSPSLKRTGSWGKAAEAMATARGSSPLS